MIHIQVDPHSGVPVYRQIMDQVRYLVASSLLKPGEQLPSIRGLAQRLRVNPATVVKAYNELQHSEVIEMRHGLGAFVADHGTDIQTRQREELLQQAARQLALQARQLGANERTVMKLVRDAMRDVRGDGAGEEEKQS